MSLSILSLWEKGKRYHFSSRMKQLPLPPGERRAGLPLTRQCHGGRCKEAWTAAYAGRTLGPPHPAVPWAPPASPAVGRGVLGSCLRRDDTGGPSAGFGFASAGLCRQGRGVETTSEGPFVQGPAGGSGRNSIDVRALYRSARALCTRSGRWKRSKSASASGRSWPVCGSTSRKHSNSMALVLSWPS